MTISLKNLKPAPVIIFFCVIKLALHVLADFYSGFQGDELLHIQTGNHPAVGYMEFPPFIGLIAFIQNAFQSQSVFVHHIFVHIASLLIIIYVAKITLELGGKTKAVFLVLLCILIAPGFGRSQQLFQPVVFSQLFWVLSFFNLVRYVKYADRKYLLYITFTIVLGFLTKYDTLFFIIGLPALPVFRQTREALVRDHFWIYLVVALVFVSPNLTWQYTHDFPVLQMFGRLYETQLDLLSPMDVVWKLILSINPLSLLIVVPALFHFYSKQLKLYWPVSTTIVLCAAVLAVSQGKQYYFFPIILTLLPFGGVFWESQVLNKKAWMIYPLTVILCIGLLLIPFGLPVYSLDTYIKRAYRFEKAEIEGGTYAIPYEERYSKSKWHETLTSLRSVYDSLPEHEQETALIWGKHYGQAGVVHLFREQYGLPDAFSYHGSFYTWAPSGKIPDVVIAFRYSREEGKDFFEPFFDEVTPVRTIYNPYADNEEELWQTIFICKKPRQDFDALRQLFSKRIFE